MGNSKKFLSLGLSALLILPTGALLSSNINAGAGTDAKHAEEEQQEQYYIATFDLNGGTYDDDCYVIKLFSGALGYLKLLTPDDREGYMFMGWESELGLLCAGAICDNLSSNIHFTAVWRPIDLKLQKRLYRFNNTILGIDKFLDKIDVEIQKMEYTLGDNVENNINMTNIMQNDEKIAAVNVELSKLDAKRKECKRKVEELKSDLGNFQRIAVLFKNRVSEVTEIINSAVDQEQVSTDKINCLGSLMQLLENEGKHLNMAIQKVFSHVSNFKMMSRNFWKSYPELFR